MEEFGEGTYKVPMKHPGCRIAEYHPAVAVEQRPKCCLGVTVGCNLGSSGLDLGGKDVSRTALTLGTWARHHALVNIQILALIKMVNIEGSEYKST